MEWFFILILAFWINGVSGDVIKLKREVRTLKSQLRSK